MPAYQNDMQTMANIVSPVDAAVQMGIQNQQSNEAEALKNQLSANTLEADSAAPGLKNLFTQAQTSAENGIAAQQQAKGSVDQALVPSDIALGQAKNQTGISAQKIQQYGQIGQVMNQVATLMEQTPQPARAAAMQQLTEKLGVDPNSLGSLMDGDPDKLRQVSNALIQGSSDYVTKMSEGAQRNLGSLQVAQTGADARISAAEASAQARIQAAQLQAQMRQQQQTFEQAAVQAAKSGNQEAYKMYSTLALQVKQAQAGITSQLVNGQPLQVPDMANGGGAPSAPPAPNAAPAGNQPPAGGNALEAEMRRRGLLQ